MPSTAAATSLAPGGASPARPDRFLAFAFAGADLLVETDLDGTIDFATGAFRARTGRDAQAFIGTKVSALFAPSDREVLDIAIALVRHTGRIVPIVLHLADSAATPVTTAAIMLGSDTPRLSITIGPQALRPSDLEQDRPHLADGKTFGRIAEQMLAASDSGQNVGLSLLEVRDWARVRECLSPADRTTVETAIGNLLFQSAQGGIAGTISDGRYGIIGAPPIALDRLMSELEKVLQSGPAAGLHAGVASMDVPLDTGPLPRALAARALRYAIGRFAAGNHLEGQGSARGLADIVAQSERHAVAVRTMLRERRFRLLYQPVVSLTDRSIHHFEALLRPHRMEALPMRNTQEFVTFAEALGLSEELDWAVLETALAALAATRGVSVAVNMSGLSMQNQAYRDRLLDRLSHMPTADGEPRLLIELTETAEIEDLDAAASTMEQLRAMQVPVCLDDFGAGVAAFRYLRAFGVDYVKLDGDYVRAAGRSVRDRNLVASMVELAATAGAAVVAEMIETEELCTIMRGFGVQFGQGWLFGKPGLLPGTR